VPRPTSSGLFAFGIAAWKSSAEYTRTDIGGAKYEEKLIPI
jgi:hypothetical protein